MNLDYHEHPITRQRRYVLTIEYGDIMDAGPFSPMDNMVLHDCSREDATIADTLLGLELLARRIEEAD